MPGLASGGERELLAAAVIGGWERGCGEWLATGEMGLVGERSCRRGCENQCQRGMNQGALAVPKKGRASGWTLWPVHHRQRRMCGSQRDPTITPRSANQQQQTHLCLFLHLSSLWRRKGRRPGTVSMRETNRLTRLGSCCRRAPTLPRQGTLLPATLPREEPLAAAVRLNLTSDLWACNWGWRRGRR